MHGCSSLIHYVGILELQISAATIISVFFIARHFPMNLFFVLAAAGNWQLCFFLAIDSSYRELRKILWASVRYFFSSMCLKGCSSYASFTRAIYVWTVRATYCCRRGLDGTSNKASLQTFSDVSLLLAVLSLFGLCMCKSGISSVSGDMCRFPIE